MGKEMILKLWQRMVPVLASVSIEPVFLLDGFAFSNMVVLVESLQFDKICQVNLNYTEEICKNFENYPNEEQAYNSKVSSFKRNDGAITSIIPLFFILFIGAWSDKYGRKIPLCLTLVTHILFSGGYLVNALFFNLSVDFLLVVGFLDSIGGGAVAFLTVANAYISDVTTVEQRTSRVALANSLWFLGGPLGTLIGTTIYKTAGYSAVFVTSLVLYIIAFGYVILLLPESHGPFSDKERLKKITKSKPTLRLRDTILRVYGLSKKRKKTQLGKTESEEEREYRNNLTRRKMFLDFFDVKRVLNSFKCVFKKREGFTRFFIFMIVLSNFLRKIGRGAYAFYFTKEVLKWEATDYGYWSTYKNILSTLGSLLAVPILSTRLKMSDNSLAMIGSVSSIMDYILYGLVTSSTFFLMWLAPAASILVNSCSIAMRAMMSKYVSPDELGQVSAVTGTVEGVVPIISTTLYSAITKNTFETFPGAQYFFGASCNILMALIFVLIMALDKSEDYDIEAAEPTKPKGPVIEKGLVIRSDSNWLFDEQNKKIRLATILLTAMNFSIEVPNIEKVYSKKNKKISTISNVTLDGTESEITPGEHRDRNGTVPVTEIATLDITEVVQINGKHHESKQEHSSYGERDDGKINGKLHEPKQRESSSEEREVVQIHEPTQKERSSAERDVESEPLKEEASINSKEESATDSSKETKDIEGDSSKDHHDGELSKEPEECTKQTNTKQEEHTSENSTENSDKESSKDAEINSANENATDEPISNIKENEPIIERVEQEPEQKATDIGPTIVKAEKKSLEEENEVKSKEEGREDPETEKEERKSKNSSENEEKDSTTEPTENNTESENGEKSDEQDKRDNNENESQSEKSKKPLKEPEESTTEKEKLENDTSKEQEESKTEIGNVEKDTPKEQEKCESEMEKTEKETIKDEKSETVVNEELPSEKDDNSEPSQKPEGKSLEHISEDDTSTRTESEGKNSYDNQGFQKDSNT